MAKSVFSYYARSHKAARKFARKGSGNRVLSSLYQVLHVLCIPTFFLTPLFSLSSYSFHTMLDKSGDAVLEKTFDDAAHPKSYFAGLIASLICLAFAGIIIGLAALAVFFVKDMIVTSIEARNAAESDLFVMLSTIVIYVIAGAFAMIALLVLQASMFIAAKNKALSAGDVLYNALGFVRNHGVKLFALNFFQILTIALAFAPFIGGGIGLHFLSENSYQFFKPMFAVLSSLVYLLTIFYGLFFFGQFATAYFYSVHLLLDDEAESTKYVVVYPKPDAEIKNGKKKGKFIEIVSNEENAEIHPMEPVSGDIEELK